MAAGYKAGDKAYIVESNRIVRECTVVRPAENLIIIRFENGVESNGILMIMLNSGSTSLPWEPYTRGEPSPSPDYPQEIESAGDGGSVVVTLSDGNDKTQTLTLPTPNGLPGIPVTSGGNYTDPPGPAVGVRRGGLEERGEGAEGERCRLVNL